MQGRAGQGRAADKAGQGTTLTIRGVREKVRPLTSVGIMFTKPSGTAMLRGSVLTRPWSSDCTMHTGHVSNKFAALYHIYQLYLLVQTGESLWAAIFVRQSGTILLANSRSFVGSSVVHQGSTRWLAHIDSWTIVMTTLRLPHPDHAIASWMVQT